MNYKILLIILLLSSLSLSLNAKTLHYGTMVNETQLIKISKVMENPDDYLDDSITIKGTVVGVCKKRGCWMTIASDKRFENLRIKVRDGDMVFPMSARGSQAIATGKLNKLEYDLAQTLKIKQRQALANNETFKPSSITEPMVVYQLVPTGVVILDQ